MKMRLLLLFLLGITFFSNCINKTPLTEEQLVYKGKWIANDDNWLQIYADGTGDFHSKRKMKNGKLDLKKSFEGGKITITNDQIKIDFLGIEEIYKIDKPPYEENGKMKMQLNGLIFEQDNTKTISIEF